MGKFWQLPKSADCSFPDTVFAPLLECSIVLFASTGRESAGPYAAVRQIPCRILIRPAATLFFRQFRLPASPPSNKSGLLV